MADRTFPPEVADALMKVTETVNHLFQLETALLKFTPELQDRLVTDVYV
jgi:hypothetical protein